jgi:hypothetical protein
VQVEKDEKGVIIKNDPFAAVHVTVGEVEKPVPLEFKKAVVVAKTTRSAGGITAPRHRG